jgi:TRAP-type C4-dicarboxylate transport system permease small subunit
MSPRLRALTLFLIDVLAFGFFAFLLVYGLGFVAGGARSFTMIYGLSKALPFAAVPVSAALACIQLVLVAIHDQATLQQQRTEARI